RGAVRRAAAAGCERHAGVVHDVHGEVDAGERVGTHPAGADADRRLGVRGRVVRLHDGGALVVVLLGAVVGDRGDQVPGAAVTAHHLVAVRAHHRIPGDVVEVGTVQSGRAGVHCGRIGDGGVGAALPGDHRVRVAGASRGALHGDRHVGGLVHGVRAA